MESTLRRWGLTLVYHLVHRVKEAWNAVTLLLVSSTHTYAGSNFVVLLRPLLESRSVRNHRVNRFERVYLFSLCC